MSFPNIAIIGAGPVGCTLARLLHQKLPPSATITIFEADTSPNYRSQGGTLDLHTATGLAALEEAGLTDKFLKHARYDGESLKITDKDLKVYIRIKATESPEGAGDHLGGRRPEIDRSALRELLVESLPEGWIRWGWKLKKVLPTKDNGAPRDHQLVFTVTEAEQDGMAAVTRTETVSGFDLIVGADGGWSKVRSGALSSTKPCFSGIVAHELRLYEAEKTAPQVCEMVNRGSVFAHSDGQRASLQQMGDGTLYVMVCYRVENESSLLDKAGCKFDATNLEETKAALLERLHDWHPLVREAVSKCSGYTTPRSLMMLPVGFSWPHRAGFTLIGDAAHLMTPFAGEGVNVGMEDALRLSRAIAAAVKSENGVEMLDREVAAFEADVCVRAGSYARLTDELRQAWFFTENSPKAVLPKMAKAHAQFHAPTLLKPFVGVLAAGYGYYKARNPN